MLHNQAVNILQIFNDVNTYYIDFVFLGNGIQANHLPFSVFFALYFSKSTKAMEVNSVLFSQHLFDNLCGRCMQDLCFLYLLYSFTLILFASIVIFFTKMLNVTQNFGITDLSTEAENGIYYIWSWRNWGIPTLRKITIQFWKVYC